MGEYADEWLDRIIDGGSWGYPTRGRRIENSHAQRRAELPEKMNRIGTKIMNRANPTDTTLLRLPSHTASLSITHNEHLATYETVEQYLSDEGKAPYCPEEWLSRSDYKTALRTNELWEMRWYPHSPVGFYIVYGSTLENMIKAGEKP